MKLFKKNIAPLFYCSIAILFYCSSCGIYSFTGASISPDVKTVTVNYFPNQASIVMPTLSQKFTEKLKEKFISQTNLTLVDANGDLVFKGAITGYEITPISPQGNQTAAQNRLTIIVNVEFENKKDAKQSWQNSFSRYADFPGTTALVTVEEQLVKEINEQIIEDIFNKAVVNW